MKRSFPIVLYVGLFVLGLWLLRVFFVAWLRPIPAEPLARAYFADHRSDFLRFAALLTADASAQYVSGAGEIVSPGHPRRVDPVYRDLARRLGLQFVTIGADGSMEFAVWGRGGAIVSDSYLGIRYCPPTLRPTADPGWAPIVVSSLDPDRLPRERDGIASGLYVVPIEPGWFIYRFEYRE